MSERSTAGATPRVFIGMPVFNGARFMAGALDSLLAQTWGDFELLIADNASTDETERIGREYAARDGRVKYHRHADNIGAPRNWNFVVERASGDYFKWATSNDTVTQDMLAKCVAALDADPGAVLCQGRTLLVDEDSGASKEYPKDLALPDERPSSRLLRLAMELSLNNGQIGLIRLAALRRTSGEPLYPNGDVALMAELALLGRFIVLPSVMLHRRMGATTFSKMLSGEGKNQFYGREVLKTRVGHALAMHLDILRAAATLPPWSERPAASLAALRYFAWNRGAIWGEMKAALGRRGA